MSGSLSALEVEDLVTVRDVATVLQRAEMVRRIAEEIEGYVIELGADGRLVMLQLDELMGGVEDDRRLVAKDYFRPSADFELDRRDAPARRPRRRRAARPGLGRVGAAPRSRHRHRQRAPTARVPAAAQDPAVCPSSSPTTWSVASRTCRRSCEPVSPTSTEVEGVGEARARAIKDGLSRLAETSILERYV